MLRLIRIYVLLFNFFLKEMPFNMVDYIFDEYFFSKSPPSISPIKTSFSCLSFREREREREAEVEID